MPAPATTDGLLLVDKPAGVSSHDVVSIARRAIGEKRIGHAGTLDPFATGLLILCAGRATRLLQHLPDEPKVYRATIRFGAETDTEDLQGEVVREAELPTRDALLAALPTFVGALEQVPPAYSAKRVDGKRAYERARAGEALDLAAVPIRVERWEVLALRDADGADIGGESDGAPGSVGAHGAARVAEAEVRVTCGGGTYVRSLARDLARSAGSAAHLVALRRERCGAFDVAQATTVEQLKAGEAPLRPALDALPGFPVQALSDDELQRIVRGIAVDASTDGAWAALVRDDRPVLVALAERREDKWQPRVVMREA
ncbi:MAG: tRNA pseudouridine(55) synthase TruB [Gemmatimonadaceae bacterium]|nr:tRNA pseudouridine(55) synthase TruB [Gemmatimonadaceae bacterium]